ncbi:hypothetical protein ACFWAZ_34810 [Streptomyces collinus]|uniref:hypothetical protein n=1 Tax=Streptomyces collinus TaxID=42684 RepID=UPI0036639E7E
MYSIRRIEPGDTNRTTRAYVRDLRTGRTALASPDAQGGPNGQSVSALVVDRHGRTVAFGSSSPGLVPGDTYDTPRLGPSPEVTDRILRQP